MRAALQLLSGQFGKPALDLIDTGCGCGSEMDMPVRPACQPRLDLRGLVSGIIVHDDMHVRACGHMPVDLFEKVQKLPRPMPFVALSDHGTGGNIQGGKERRRAVADVRVGAPFRHAGRHALPGR